MSSVFTKIINGEIPAYKIAENEHFIAFLDVMPLVKGHTLVVPKKEVDLIFDLDSEDYKNLWSFAQNVAKKVKKAIPCKGRCCCRGSGSTSCAYTSCTTEYCRRYEL